MFFVDFPRRFTCDFCIFHHSHLHSFSINHLFQRIKLLNRVNGTRLAFDFNQTTNISIPLISFVFHSAILLNLYKKLHNVLGSIDSYKKNITFPRVKLASCLQKKSCIFILNVLFVHSSKFENKLIQCFQITSRIITPKCVPLPLALFRRIRPLLFRRFLFLFLLIFFDVCLHISQVSK